ncbi:hypothetical protein HDR58_02795 [bacterium]|nr:hypothetical protein [bacterium]
MKVVVLGKGLALANIVLGVLDSGAELVGVLRYERTCKSRCKLFMDDFFCPAPEVTLLKSLKVPQLNFESANCPKFRKWMIANNIDLLIVGTWKERIAKETFNIPTIATVNVHPSLLPKYRGPNPYLQAILHGETESGVTLHLLNEKFDAGAILKQEKVSISESDTSKELREKSVRVVRQLISDLVSDLNNKILTPITQNEKYATYFPNISGNEKMLDFSLQSSTEIVRTIRALHPFLPTYITHNDKFLVVNPYNFQVLNTDLNSKPGDIVAKDAEKASLTITCKDGKSIKFYDLKLYKSSFKTKKYIEKEIKVISC